MAASNCLNEKVLGSTARLGLWFKVKIRVRVWVRFRVRVFQSGVCMFSPFRVRVAFMDPKPSHSP